MADAELLSVTIGQGVVPQSVYLSKSSAKDSSNLDRSKYKAVQPGQVVYNKMRAWQGAVGLSHWSGIVSPAYVVLDPVGLRGDYAHLLMRTPGFATEAERWSYGIASDMWSLRPEHFRLIEFPCPPASEQAAIVKYVGHAHARIDHAIAAKRKLITLLEEQEQVVVRQAVTRGVDVNAPLRDSGSAWPGSTPTHWDLVPLKRLVRTVGGMTPSKADSSFWTGSMPWVSPKDVKTEFIGDSIDHVSERALQETGLSLLEAGSVLIVVRGMILARKVPVAINEVPVTINQDMKALRPRPWLLAAYLKRVLEGAQGELLSLVETSGHGTKRLETSAWGDFLVPLPSVEEQEEVLAALRKEFASLGALRTRAHREIALLEEFRTRLTSDVVTGQVDVRGIADSLADLPDEELAQVDDGLDPLDEAEEYLDEVGA